MQNTITARRISYNLIALVVVLVAAAMLIGFVAGLAVTKPSSAAVSPASRPEPVMVTKLQVPTAGWAYHYDALNNKWHAYHYSTTPTGPVIDEIYELQSAPNGIVLDGCVPLTPIDTPVEC